MRTPTASAGEGKSSVIAQMVTQDGSDETTFHVIALTAGHAYQFSLFQLIVARLMRIRATHGGCTTQNGRMVPCIGALRSRMGMVDSVKTVTERSSADLIRSLA